MGQDSVEVLQLGDGLLNQIGNKHYKDNALSTHTPTVLNQDVTTNEKEQKGRHTNTE